MKECAKMLVPFQTEKKKRRKKKSMEVDMLTRKPLRRKEVAKGDVTPWALNSSGSTHSQKREREMDSYGVIRDKNLN